MNLSHRKLLAESLCESVCTSEAKATNGHCSDFCQGRCPEPCSIEYPPLVPPQDDDPGKTPHPNASQKLFHESVIISLSILGVVCLIFCLRIIYRRYKNRENLRRGLPNQDQGRTRDEFFDEENGPILDHPIWYIRTVGLQPSLIDLITVCKYKRGEGLVEGTECSVCLSEFEDDETLRLLPKCNHAFHIPCIDTWLRSHTNCPMCRAPIFANPDWALSPILERSAENSAAQGEAQGVVPEGSGELARERESGEFESGRETEQLQTSVGTKGVEASEQQGMESVEIREKDEIQPMRRSVSMDYLTASTLISALASSRFGESNETNTGIGPKRNHQKKGQVRMNRSVSCSGKLMFSRQ